MHGEAPAGAPEFGSADFCRPVPGWLYLDAGSGGWRHRLPSAGPLGRSSNATWWRCV